MYQTEALWQGQREIRRGSMKKEFVKLSAVLCLITLVAALVLAGVNRFAIAIQQRSDL